MTYRQALKYLNSFQNLEKKTFYNYNKTFKLESISKLCDIIGRPQNDFKCILVSGTKGKGSVCAILHSVLLEAGYKAGLYTSPHLLDLRERIKVNKEVITKEEFSGLIEEIKESIKYARVEDAHLYRSLTFFEVLTAVCFLYFSKNKIDLAVIEVGLGGRLDATNITYPLVSAITSISYDHTQQLGGTLAKIAKEKAGIIKENSFTVCAPQKKEVINVIKTASREKNNRLFIVGKDIKYRCPHIDFNKTVFDYFGIYNNYKNIKLSLVGEHQAQNGAISLAILEILKHHCYFRIARQSIVRGFKKVDWPGRFHILGKGPRIIADGAHNKNSALALKQTLLDLAIKEKIDTLILGFSSDKDIKGIGSILCPVAKNVIFTKSSSPRAAEPAILKNLLYKNCRNYFLTKTPKQALSIAKELTRKNGIILITGSLFLVGDILKFYETPKR